MVSFVYLKKYLDLLYVCHKHKSYSIKIELLIMAVKYNIYKKKKILYCNICDCGAQFVIISPLQFTRIWAKYVEPIYRITYFITTFRAIDFVFFGYYMKRHFRRHAINTLVWFVWVLRGHTWAKRYFSHFHSDLYSKSEKKFWQTF